MSNPNPKPMNLKTAHKPELDDFTPAMIRTLAEFLLYTMSMDQRHKLIQELPEFYRRLYGVVPELPREPLKPSTLDDARITLLDKPPA